MRNINRCLRNLNTWSSVGDPVWGRLERRALLEEVWPARGWALKASMSLPVGSLGFVLLVENWSSQLPLPTAMPTGCSYASCP